jgi:hypothetical protein
MSLLHFDQGPTHLPVFEPLFVGQRLFFALQFDLLYNILSVTISAVRGYAKEKTRRAGEDPQRSRHLAEHRASGIDADDRKLKVSGSRRPVDRHQTTMQMARNISQGRAEMDGRERFPKAFDPQPIISPRLRATLDLH